MKHSKQLVKKEKKDRKQVAAAKPVLRLEDGEELISSGAYGCAAVFPAFSARQLADLDTLGEKDFGQERTRKTERRIRKAQAAAKRQLRVWSAARSREAVKHSPSNIMREQRKNSEELPSDKSLKTRLGLGTGFAGNDSASFPWHTTSVRRAGILTPWLSAGRPVLDGPVIGWDALSGIPFQFDAWSPYNLGLASSVNGMIAGIMGSGKSMCLKTLAVREIGFGRNVIIEGDPKGEWRAVAAACGGQVIHAGDGEYLNPLDAGVRPASIPEKQWEQDVLILRGVALRSLAAAVRGSELDMSEQTVADAAAEYLGRRFEEPTLADFVALLHSDWIETASLKGLDPVSAREAANSLILIFNMFVEGRLRGSFDRKSTVHLDSQAPLIVFDTGGSTDSDPQRKAVFTAAMNSAVERLCAARDGKFRIVIAEEGWALLSNPVIVAAWDKRIRLSGELGVSNWMLLHELADLDKFASKGTAMRERITSILTLSEIKVLHRQSASSIDTLRELLPDLTDIEAEQITELPTGIGLWRIGSKLRQLVLPVPSDEEHAIFDTSANRKG